MKKSPVAKAAGFFLFSQRRGGNVRFTPKRSFTPRTAQYPLGAKSGHSFHAPFKLKTRDKGEPAGNDNQSENCLRRHSTITLNTLPVPGDVESTQCRNTRPPPYALLSASLSCASKFATAFSMKPNTPIFCEASGSDRASSIIAFNFGCTAGTGDGLLVNCLVNA